MLFFVHSPSFYDLQDFVMNVKTSESNVLHAEQKFSMYENVYICMCCNNSFNFVWMKEDQF
jgi:hypothetical protein